MQRAQGLPVRWLTSAEVDAMNPTMAPGCTLGATYCDEDGYITPPRNVAAYTAALVGDRRRHRRADAVHRADARRLRSGRSGRHRATSRGSVSAGLVVLAGGPQLAAVGALAGISVPAGGVRHRGGDRGAPGLRRTPMAFDVPSGLYWRPEEGGLLFGMSDPDEPPGENRRLDFDYLALMRAKLAALVPLTAGLACGGVGGDDRLHARSPADHRRRGRLRPGGGGVGQRGRHEWGPAVARCAADVALGVTSTVVEDVSLLGLDRFDASGRSRLAADPIALPFPEKLAFPEKAS